MTEVETGVDLIETAVQDGAEDALIEGQAVIGVFQIDMRANPVRFIN